MMTMLMRLVNKLSDEAWWSKAENKYDPQQSTFYSWHNVVKQFGFGLSAQKNKNKTMHEKLWRGQM